MESVKNGFPDNNTNNLKRYLGSNFSELPQLLGGNHGTAALKKIFSTHFPRDPISGEENFVAPPGSNVRQEHLARFNYRTVNYVISPVTLQKTKSSSRLRAALLQFSRMLNDHSKNVKRSTLHGQLLKAREALHAFLTSAREPKKNSLIFKEGEDIWPSSHADYEKSVYSKRGIQDAVRAVISQEFQSSVSHLKQIALCPEDVFQLLLSITSRQCTQKEGQFTPIVNSTKYLVHFTLSFCPKDDLVRHLREIEEDISSRRNKSSQILPISNKQKQMVTLNRMLLAIYSDLTTGDNRHQIFSSSIGGLSVEGIILEGNFQKVHFAEASNTCSYSLTNGRP
jgi:hypothetical protein